HAAKLNWHPLDLFGCDRERPFARLDHAGLLWLLNGRQLLALTADTAAIATPSGGSLTFRRRPVEPGHVVLAWDLKQLRLQSSHLLTSECVVTAKGAGEGFRASRSNCAEVRLKHSSHADCCNPISGRIVTPWRLRSRR